MSPKVSGTEPLFVEAQHFIECLETGSRPITDGADGLTVVAALEAADLSLRSNGAPQTISLRG